MKIRTSVWLIVLSVAMILLAQDRGPAIPSQLAGNWEAISTSTVGFVNRQTGSFSAPSGEGTTYHIFPDGQYKKEALIQSSLGACTDTVFITERGNVTIQESTIVFAARAGELESRDNCTKRFNYKKPLTLQQRTFGWRLQRDQFGVQLCLSKAGFKDSCYYKK